MTQEEIVTVSLVFIGLFEFLTIEAYEGVG